MAIATKYDASSIASAPVLFGSGTVAAPSIAFVSDTGTGLFRVGAGDLGVAITGTQVVDIQAATITLFNSSVAAAATLQGTNTNTAAGNDMRASLSAGTTNVQLTAQNQNGAVNQYLTGAVAGAAALLRALGNYPLYLGVNGMAIAGITTGTNGTGTWPTFQTVDQNGNFFDLGYRDVPVNQQASTYATVMADRGKTVLHNSASSHTFTINDATLNYPVGTVIAFMNENTGGVLTIALQTTAANLIWAPSGSTGNRTLAASGFANCTVQKITSGTPGIWVLNGVGVS